MNWVSALRLLSVALFWFGGYFTGHHVGRTSSRPPSPTCEREMSEAERCVGLLTRSTKANQLCLDLLGAARDAGSY